MNQHFYISNAEEWFDLDRGSAVLIDVGGREVDGMLINRLVSSNPSLVSFFGQNAEAWHDTLDRALAQEGQEPVTTWHCEESPSDVVWEFFNVHVPHNSSDSNVFVIGLDSEELLREAKLEEKNSRAR